MLQTALDKFKIVEDRAINFWEVNPLFRNIKEFQDFYHNDNTKDRSYSSKAMWCIAMAYDLNDSNPFRNLNLETRKEKVVSYLIDKRSSFSWEKHEHLCKLYYELVNSVPLRTRDSLYKKMVERDKYITDTKYEPTLLTMDGKVFRAGTVKELDEMIGRTNKLYDQLKEIDSIIEAEKNRGFSGKLRSASQTGQL